MRTILSLVLFISFLNCSFGQNINRNAVISFWETNVKAIVELNKEAILEQTHFPLEGSWGYVLELPTSPEEWTRKDYEENLEKLFSEELRSKIKEQTYNDLVHHKDENGENLLIVNVVFTEKDPESGFILESSTMLFFKQFNNVWKLYSIEYAG